MKNKFRIINIAINLKAADYNQMVHDRALDWINANLSLNDDVIMNEVCKSPLFWEWWKNQWKIRDEKFAYELSLTRHELPLDGAYLKVARELYADAHALSNIKVKPNRYVMVEIGRLLLDFTAKQNQHLNQLIYANRG